MAGPVLPPTTEELLDANARPYFLWWLSCTVEQFRRNLADPDPRERGYWLGVLLRESNSRDVRLFTNRATLKRDWAFIVPHLGNSRAMWAWILDEDGAWPPAEARVTL